MFPLELITCTLSIWRFAYWLGTLFKKKFFLPRRKKASVPDDAYIVVPGNHDASLLYLKKAFGGHILCLLPFANPFKKNPTLA
jgi:hypothetical protein